jgi:DNA-binding transcriptional LysR family regulator
MNLHLLRVFAAVAQHNGVGAAARALRVSQPAVSRAVRELEEQVGLTLLERTGRGIRLTSEGTDVYRQARDVFAAERMVEETIAGLKGIEHGSLHIGASTTIATYVLPGIVGAFARAHPGIAIELTSVHTRTLVDLLRNYELDVAIAEAAVDDDRIAVTRWATDEMVVICAPGHRLAATRAISAATLADELLILRELESGTRTIVDRALAAAGIIVRRSMSVDSTEVIKQLVANGLGVGIVSRVAVRDQLALRRLVTVDVTGLHVTRPFNRLAVRGRVPSGAARSFLKMLAAAKRG